MPAQLSTGYAGSFLKLFDALPESPLREETCGTFSSYRQRTEDGTGFVPDQTEAQIDIQLASVLLMRARSQHPVYVFELARVDGFPEPFPMRALESFGNDYVEAPSQSLGGKESEDRFSAAVPDLNRTVAIGEDDGIRSLLDDGLKQSQIGVIGFGSISHRYGSTT